MEIPQEILDRIGQPESERLEYKAVLPPAATVAQLISSFANSHGGAIVLGVVDEGRGITINGLSDDFQAIPITRKAIDLLSPLPIVTYDYVIHSKQRLFVISVEESEAQVTLGGKSYVRTGARTTLQQSIPDKAIRNAGIAGPSKSLSESRKFCTAARAKLLDHYESVLRILDDLGNLLYPRASSIPTDYAEGKVLMRILFSTCADTFEMYMSDLLYEIYLAKPEALKSESTVTVKEVLDCSDMPEFISYYAKGKLKKLQRGSVKGFISDNKQIQSLGIFDVNKEEEIEKILQIRHLYTHQNGIVDEKLRNWFPAARLNDEYRMTLNEFIDRFEYLARTIEDVDEAARKVYKLASFS